MKEFKVSSWSIDNKTSIYVLTVIIAIAGTFTYINLPKEQFPEIVFPQLFINTAYPGASPTDIENVITKHIEKQLKSIPGVKKITSNSVQDFSNVAVEFNTDVNVAVAKQKVEDAVDKAKTDLPKDLPQEPQIIEIDVSQIPIMNVNVSGDMELDKIKKYAEDLQDRIEALKEITRVDMLGALQREIQINVDKFKMEAANITMTDITRAIASENMTMSGGSVKVDGMKRAVSIVGEFKDVNQIGNIIVRGGTGAKLYLKDVAEIKDSYEEKETFANLDGKNVITLNVIKRSGENLINSSDKIRAIVKDMAANKFPPNLKVTITADQSSKTRVTVHDLINTIIIGFILVTIILMFFMGTTNAIFVALSVPMSMFIAFLLMPWLGFTLNMIVLFAFLLALGIVVDDAIVVVENTHRVYDNGKVPIKQAAKQAAGEVFLPVLSGTLTTLAPFIPLAFWKGTIGKFMFFLPVTLIVTLLASLFVAYVMNPVFAVDFMKPHDEHEEGKTKITKGFKIVSLAFAILAILFYAIGNFGLGNFTVLIYLLFLLNKFVLVHVIKNFQEKTWPKVQNAYERLLIWVLQKGRPIGFLVGTIALLIFSFIFVGMRGLKVVFFPQADPNFIYTYIKLPIGTDQTYTDSITNLVEHKIVKVMGEKNPDVESVISNVGLNVSENPMEGFSIEPNKGKVTVAFVEYAHRQGENTRVYLDKIREAVKGIPGAEISVDQERGGPPVGKPISIEITGDDYKQLIDASEGIQRFIASKQIGGIEQLKSDLIKNKPEVVISIDRMKANTEGISTGQIAGEIRNALFGQGSQASKFRDENDEYPIQVRYAYNQRNDIEALLNLKITYRDMNMGGQIRQVPLSSLASIKYEDSYGGIKRKNQKRMITLSSNVLNGYNANNVVTEITEALKDYDTPEGVGIKMAGEQEDQKETGAFLVGALMTSLGLIFFILVTQFNSVAKPLIIISEIAFSIIGVLLGFSIFKMDISILMTGIGIVALAGIVVRNGILLVEFTEILEHQGMPTTEAIIYAGKTRMTPVLLTATATILGLVPLAVGLNIDFVTLFTELNPHIFFGGDSVAFWGPLSWTMIFGLMFATFLTLVLVPSMYYIAYVKIKKKKKTDLGHEHELTLQTV